MMAKLDDVMWHFGGDGFPEGLPEENGATHIGYFVTWLIRNGQWTDFLDPEAVPAIEAVKSGQMSGRTFVMEYCDGKLVSQMISSEITPFAHTYYDKQYLTDYQETLARGLSSDYLVADTEANYATIAAVIDQRLADWRGGAIRP